MKRYTYSRVVETSEGMETFTADQFDSFDEAINAVNKGIYERQLFLDEKRKKKMVAEGTGVAAPIPQSSTGGTQGTPGPASANTLNNPQVTTQP